jgi:hypothetical protein
MDPNNFDEWAMTNRVALRGYASTDDNWNRKTA